MALDITKHTLPELLKLVNSLPASKRVDHLRQIANIKPDLKTVLQLVYHRDIQFVIPEGTPPYKPLDIPNNWGYNRLPKELKKFRYFATMIPSNLTQVRKEQIFIEMLESVSPEEAELVIQIKDKKLSSYKNINRKLVEEALPELFVGEKAQPEVKTAKK